MDDWNVGDKCKLILLQTGKVLEGEIHALERKTAIVRVSVGRLYRLFRVDRNSSFLQRP